MKSITHINMHISHIKRSPQTNKHTYTKLHPQTHTHTNAHTYKHTYTHTHTQSKQTQFSNDFTVLWQKCLILHLGFFVLRATTKNGTSDPRRNFS